MTRRRGFLGLALAVLALLVAVALPAQAHHKPGHHGGPPTTTTLPATTTTVPATTTTGEPVPTTFVTPTTVRVVGDPRGPQPGVTAPAGAQVVAPGNSIASAITAAGTGGTVFLQAGLHRLAAPVTPLANQTLLGEYGAVVDGSVVISGPWTVDGAAWWADAQLPASASTTGVCESGGDDCKPAEDVYRDGHHLQRVMTQAAVGPGQYFGDYTNNRIYVGDDPNGHLIEQAKTAAMIGNAQGVQGGVTVRNLQIRKFANTYQHAAVVANHGGGSPTNFWTISQCEVYLNHANGLGSFAHNTVFYRNLIRDNGNLGISTFNNDFVRVSDNLLTRNNNNGFAVNNEAGGMKLVKVDDAIIDRNEATYNVGCGIWIDIDSRRVLIEGNTVSGNTHHGVHFEISYDATIRGNTIVGNTDKGIQVNAATRGTVDHNTLAGNGWGMWFIEDPNRQTSDPPSYPGDPRTLLGWTVADNTVDHRSASNYAAGIILQNGGDPSHLAEVSFNRDAYRLLATSDSRFYYNTANTFAQWQGNGKDTDGSVGT